MKRGLALIGAPTSAGAYAPGQEKAPAMWRDAGLISALENAGLTVRDLGDTRPARWRPDPAHPNAMNLTEVAGVASELAGRVATAATGDNPVLVLGGDCTVEVGTVAGLRQHGRSIGLVYIDLDADLQTPESTSDGALDWMVVAHLIGAEGTCKELSQLAGEAPLLHPDCVCLFGAGNVMAFERQLINDSQMVEVPIERVRQAPRQAAAWTVRSWASQFEWLAVHLDLDILDFADFPVAENTRRYQGLKITELQFVLCEILGAPNLKSLTITEANPDHCDDAMHRFRHLSEMLASALGSPVPASQQPTDRP